jgi:LuxR family quorum sensing-dependent transcriptional regulator
MTETKIDKQLETAKQAHLYPCEIEALYWAARGKTSQETAIILNLKENTIATYRKEAIKKLNASNITNAVWLATEVGLLG